MIRTIIVDDEILSRIGIQSFLESEADIEVLGIFAEAEEALHFLRNNRVDVVITDIEMSEMNGLELITCIRSENLVEGIIIMSCHDDFRYAQEAISRGTNSYMLKEDVSKEAVIAEVRKVYEKTKQNYIPVSGSGASQQEDEMKDSTYAICVLQTQHEEEEQMGGTMLVHLLEDVVSRYSMGTLFAPSGKEMFIIFRFDSHISSEERELEIEDNLSVIRSNVEQYVNGRVVYGLSSRFTDIQKMREKYAEAVSAARLSFYETNLSIFEWTRVNKEVFHISFSTSRFMDEEGGEAFKHELENILVQARRAWFSVELLKEQLIHGVNTWMYQILNDNGASKAFNDKWRGNAMFFSMIANAAKMTNLETAIIETITIFRRELKSELEFDELSDVFRYIEQHMGQKIVLSDLAEASCMSVASLCKKFKEREGCTPLQYINERRIEKAKILMRNRNNSLWQIAEMTGFSNVNYLIRVFKKMTGTTIGNYRKQFGIIEDSELK